MNFLFRFNFYLNPNLNPQIAVAIGGSALLGAGTSLFAGNQQSNAIKDATNQANQIQQQEYQQARTDNAPYQQAGYSALNTITQDQKNGTGFATPFNMNSFYSDPGYQFTLQQGTNAINNSASANGGVLNGGTLKALSQYTTGLANQTYGDAYNRYLQNSTMQYNQLAGVANMGQQAINSITNSGTNSANQQSSNTLNGLSTAAGAQASGITGAVNSLAGGVGAYYGYQALSNIGKSSYGGGNGLTTNQSNYLNDPANAGGMMF